MSGSTGPSTYRIQSLQGPCPSGYGDTTGKYLGFIFPSKRYFCLSRGKQRAHPSRKIFTPAPSRASPRWSVVYPWAIEETPICDCEKTFLLLLLLSQPDLVSPSSVPPSPSAPSPVNSRPLSLLVFFLFPPSTPFRPHLFFHPPILASSSPPPFLSLVPPPRPPSPLLEKQKDVSRNKTHLLPYCYRVHGQSPINGIRVKDRDENHSLPPRLQNRLPFDLPKKKDGTEAPVLPLDARK